MLNYTQTDECVKVDVEIIKYMQRTYGYSKDLIVSIFN